MSRKILIEKVSQSTKVTTWDSLTPLNKKFYLYNLGADVILDSGVITVIDKENNHPNLHFVFDDLDDDLGATDLETYLDAMATNLFFLVAGDTPEPAPVDLQNLQETVDEGMTADKIELKVDLFQGKVFTPDGASSFFISRYIPLADGAVIMGSFGSYDGVARNNIVKINLDGTLDTNFNVGTGLLPNGTNFIPQGAHLGTVSGKYYLVGSTFTSYNGNTSSPKLIRLNADGSVDATFSVGTGFAGSYPLHIQEDSLGRVVVCGRFSGYNGTSFGSNTGRCIRLTSTGVLDNTFAPVAFDNVALTVLVNADNSVYITGYFATANAVASSGIVKVDSSGVIDTSFVVGTGFVVAGNLPVQIKATVDGKLIVYGNMVTYKGSAVNRIVKLNHDGSVDGTFVAGTGFNALVGEVHVRPDGKFVVTGVYATYNGTASHRLIILNSDGTVYRTFFKNLPNNDTGTNIILGANKEIILKVGTVDRRLYKVNDSGYFENSRSVTFNPTTGKFEYSIIGLSETTSQELLPKVLIQEFIVQLRKQLDVYTVATLPTVPAPVQGQMAFVTDATAPTYLGALVGGGAVKCPVVYNGTAWVSH